MLKVLSFLLFCQLFCFSVCRISGSGNSNQVFGDKEEERPASQHENRTTRITQGCDFYQNAELGALYYIYSPNYPDTYPGGVQCRWYADSPPGTYLTLNCSEFITDATSNCAADRLMVSPTGDLQLGDAHVYCGVANEPFTLDSTTNKMNIVFQSGYYPQYGNRFLCTMQALVTPPPTCECGRKKEVS